MPEFLNKIFDRDRKSRPKPGQYSDWSSDLWDKRPAPPVKRKLIHPPAPKRPVSHQINYDDPYSGTYYNTVTGRSYERVKPKTGLQRINTKVRILMAGALAAGVFGGAAALYESNRQNQTIERTALPTGQPTQVIELPTQEPTKTAQPPIFFPHSTESPPTQFPTTEPTQVASATKQPTTEVTVNKDQATPELSPTPNFEQNSHRFLTVGGFNFEVDDHDIPQAYTDSQGNRHQFSDAEIATFKAKQTSASTNKLAELIWQNSSPTDSSENQWGMNSDVTKNKNVPQEAPANIVSNQELLSKYGITIYNTDSTSFHLRASAFQSGGLLGNLAEYRQRTNNNLIIVLLSTSTVRPEGLPDSVPETLKPTLLDILSNEAVDVEAYRQKLVSQLQQTIDDIKADSQPLDSDDILISFELDLEEAKAASADQLIAQARNDQQKDAAGLFTSRFINGQETNIIFMATGKDEANTQAAKQALYFDSSGHLQSLNLVSMYLISGADFVPSPQNSYPARSDLTRNPNASPDKPDVYPYGAQRGMTGFVIAHEIGHLQQKIEGDENSTFPVFSENGADEFAGTYVDRANNLMTQGSDEGFQMVFENSQGVMVSKIQPRTENQSRTAATSMENPQSADHEKPGQRLYLTDPFLGIKH